MAGFTITANNQLRNLYTNNRNLVNKSERLKVSTKELTKADSNALSKGIAALGSYDYESEVEEKDRFSSTLKAFQDTYNNTIKSGTDLSESDPTTKRLVKEMKKLKSEYGDELANYGITFDEKGYMSMSDTALQNISVKSFEDILGEDSRFLKDLSSLSKKISRRINYLI